MASGLLASEFPTTAIYRQGVTGRTALWQQAGLEAFDAMHNWLLDQEKQGKFEIADPKLRAAFYHYWTTHNHGSFLTDDQERIRSEFLEPDWAPMVASHD